MKTFRSMLLNPLSKERFDLIKDGALRVDKGGRIVGYGHFSDVRKKSDEVLDYRDYVIMPGLIDTHVHLPQYDMVAMDGFELLDWLNKYTFPAEKRFESAYVARDAAKRFFYDLRKNGTTAASVYCTIHKEATDVSFEEAEKSGLRVVMGKVMMDQNAPDFLLEKTLSSVEDSIELCKKWNGKNGGKLMYSFTPRFAPTCSMELMRAASSYANKLGAHIQTHLSENKGEIDWVKKLFPKYRNYTDVYSSAGLLTDHTIMAHSIYLSDGELRMLKEKRTKISHCPSSNFFLKSGVFDLQRAWRLGLDVGLGSDVGGGPNLSLFREMTNECNASKVNYLFGKSHSVLDPAAALYTATLGGAKALNMDRRIGNLSKGKLADFLVLDAAAVDPLNNIEDRSKLEILSQLIYRGDDRVVVKTYVDGKPVYERK